MAVLLSELGSASSLLPAINASFSRSDSKPSLQIGRVAPPPRGIESWRRKRAEEAICTADELHYAPVPNSDWRIALWRYLPSPKAPRRNHPLLLLSGVGTKALGYDLSPESSFARFMSGQGFDTWIVELRGVGLSSLRDEIPRRRSSSNDQLQTASDLLENFISISKKFDPFLDRGSKILELTKKIEDFKKELELIPWYDWDFDNYLEEDVPSAMEYVRNQSEPKDGKLLAIGHSMGGNLLYAMLSKCSFEGRETGLASVTTLASTLDYSSSNSFCKNLLLVAEPVRASNISVIPIGVMYAMAHPFMFRPPYALSCLTTKLSAPQMMNPELLEKLVLNNFCTVPSKLLLQLSTAAQDSRGLQDITGTFYYKEHIGESTVPILAIAGDRDSVCPPDAVYETVKLIPESLVTYKVVGEPGGPHYGHYDLIGSLAAPMEVYPLIVQFLELHDEI
ncbi:PREDICTED: uncharacterized protein LOC104812153 isoform X2 [Tarenaya hassleriana]|uniref:uncharacterized protein LOC104812153 isoform X2 n=1 Tax=Tarenaya hassleriana TaxID=28532 RepID=UPI00053C5F7E|nr:PREDICTED: uncharacterized protein LOC104812153 isoform X2 [Tarenaya hassleriana]